MLTPVCGRGCFPAQAAFPDGYVALCLVVRNQAADLEEWLQYHKYIGVSKVYL